MSKYTKTTITQLSANEQAALEAINKNFTDIQESIQDAVSRSGQTPTQMTADLDLNGKRIINVPTPQSDNDLVRRKDVVGDINTIQNLTLTATSAAAEARESADLVESIIEDHNVGLIADDFALGDSSNIKITATNISNVNAVGGSISNVNAVAGNATNINAVNANKTNIDTVASDISKVQTVSNNINSVNTVSASISNVNEVAGNATNINAVAGNTTNINAVNANKTNIDTVAGNNSNITTVAGNSSNVTTVATNISGVNTCASNISSINSASTNAANAAASATSAADSAALAYQYGNDKINQTHITNCITEIPQDIKLELNNGTLTLKAGSKVYMPNGSGVFDAVTIASDKTVSTSGSNTFDCFIYYSTQDNGLRYGSVGVSVSGSSYSITDGYWYDTTNNLIKRIVSSAVSYSGLSFPIAIVSVVSGFITSINQIFNGFGYIGSTVFALPGVKGLIPDGRNADGTLKNTEFTLNSVKTTTFSGTTSRTGLFIRSSGYIGEGNSLFYNEDKNFVYYNPTSTSPEYFAIFGYCQLSSGVISNFVPKTSFHAVDYNDLFNDNHTYAGKNTFTGDNTYTKNIEFDSSISSNSSTKNMIVGKQIRSDVESDVFIKAVRGQYGGIGILLEARTGTNVAKFGISATPNSTTQSVSATSGIKTAIGFFSTPSYSLTQNGFVKLVNGTIIQWGVESLTSSNKTVTLPTAFSSTNYSVSVSQEEYSSISNQNLSAYNYTTTSFDLFANSTERAEPIHWIAIGY